MRYRDVKNAPNSRYVCHDTYSVSNQREKQRGSSYNVV